MFIKAGIVVSAAAATLLAVSPLAFAGDYHKDSKDSHHKSSKDDDNDRGDDDNDRDWKKHHHGHKSKNGGDCNQEANNANVGNSSGLINLSNLNVQAPIGVCDNDIVSGVLGVLSSDLTNIDTD